MEKLFAVTAVLALLCLGVAAQADVFNLGSGLTNLETVTVGNPGNAADTASHSGNLAGQGSVSYTYNIGKYEVTTAQYTELLNAVAKTDTYGLYSTYMNPSGGSLGCNIKRSGSSGNYSYAVGNGSQTDLTNWGNRPVNYVSYWDSCRFANWLGNGQLSGAQNASTTERGAYTLDGYTGTDGRSIQRNVGWTWALTSEDEWYKAAYYDPSKPGGACYWDYATRSDTAPANEILPADPGNSANYYKGVYSIRAYYRTNVGEFENSASGYGTFDQDGNVCEWNEAIPCISGAYASRCLRGGSFSNADYSLQSSTRYDYTPSNEDVYTGFRVSQVVPEPSSIIALLGGLISLIGITRRRA